MRFFRRSNSMPEHTTKSATLYEKTWKKRLELIQEIAKREPSLPRALALVRRTEEQRRNMENNPKDYVAFDRVVQLPWRSGAALHRSAVVEAVLDHCTDQTTKIIELGSGWGEHLCNIYDEGGPQRAAYYACEITEYGRKCAENLAGLEKNLNLKALYFDYTEPDYSQIPSDKKHTIVFSVHSVEQVREIPREVITSALSLGNEVTGIHFEPIGWQMIPENEKNEITRAHEQRCRDQEYNENFWQLILDLQSEGAIKCLAHIPNFYGLDHNPGSFILWKKV